jgi:hypothetical protein
LLQNLYKGDKLSSARIDTKVTVPKDKYLEILGFTIYSYITRKITPYSTMRGGVRTLGEYIENFVYGKVAEVALQIFLKNKMNIETLTDIDLTDFIEGKYLPDLIVIKRDTDYEPLKLWIEVKEVRRDQRWLLIPRSAVKSRPYDLYVAVWVGLPDDHVAWLVKHVPDILNRTSSEWRERFEDIGKNVENIPCEIIGFVTWNDVSLVVKAHEKDESAQQELNKKFGQRRWHYFSKNKKLFDPEDPSWKGSKVGENIGFYLKKLREVSDWNTFRALILDNKRLVELTALKDVKMKKKMKKGSFPKTCEEMRAGEDFREFAQRCIELQLGEMKRRYGSLLRTRSWFEQPLKA